MTASTQTNNNVVLANHGLRFFAYRVLSFLRPRPRYMPLSVSQILDSQKAIGVVDKFNDLCYTGGVFKLNWRGVEVLKNPCDLWMTMELMQKLRPTVIFETGTHFGGSASFYADMAATMGLDCQVITVDLNPKLAYKPATKNIMSLVGMSTDPKIHAVVGKAIETRLKTKPGAVMAFLDSDHSKQNVLEELRLYSPFVSVGSYCVVEDTNVNGHPSFAAHGPGPWEAVQEFLQENKSFSIDTDCERFLLTFNPQGWLKRHK